MIIIIIIIEMKINNKASQSINKKRVNRNEKESKVTGLISNLKSKSKKVL